MDEPLSYLHKKPDTGFTPSLIKIAFVLALGSAAAAGYLTVKYSHEHKKMDTLEASMVQLRERVEAVEKERDAALEEKKTVQAKLKEVLKDLLDRESTFQAGQKDLEAARLELKAAQDSAAALKAELAKSKEIALKQAVSGTAAGPMKVRTVNAQFEFLIINPVDSSVQVGDSLVVDRGKTRVAVLRVEQIDSGFAKAHIVKSASDGPQVGDDVSSAA